MKNPYEYRKNVLASTRNGTIRSGKYQKMYNPCEYRKIVPAITEKGSNLCEYRKMVESGRVPGKGRIRTSIEKLSPRLTEKCRICVSTEKW